MTLRFPATPTFSGADAPMRIEAAIHDLEVEGDLPRSLNGSWYRVGPDPQYPPRLGDDVYINGDGMVSMFRFENGHVDFRCRYVRTERFCAERAARRSLFGRYRNAVTDDASVRGVARGTANTAPVWHAGRLLILKEDSLPYEVDPDTLETRGVWTADGALGVKTMTAHPKIDPDTGELLAFTYEADGDGSREMALIVIGADGKLKREERFAPPYVAMAHDFAVTQRHFLFPLFPTLMDPERLAAGGPHWMSDESRESFLGVLDRSAGSTDAIRWFRRPAGHAYHVINAFSEGDHIHLDLAVSEQNSFPFIPDISGRPYDPARAAPVPMRWTVDLSRNDDHIEEHMLSPIPGDLPRIDDRRTGRPYRHCYMGMVDPARVMLKGGPIGAAFNMVGRLDVETRQPHPWYGDDRTSFQEPQFVPDGPGELAGHVLVVMDRHDENRADVGVFDAARFADGPIAVIRLPIRLRTAFHGTWVPAEARA